MENIALTEEKIPNNNLDFRGKPILRGKVMNPLKLIIYGDNGVGKTTFCAGARNPILWDLEGNSGHIEGVDKKTDLFCLEDCEEYLSDLLNHNHDYKTLIIDSLDSLETLFAEKITRKHSASELGFGKSKDIWAKYIKEFIEKLNKLQRVKKMNILITANWKVKQVNNPMADGYDRHDLRINEAFRTGFCTWVQCILLAMKDVIIDNTNTGGFGKKKAKDIKRHVLYTSGSPVYYGKNVFNLPEKLPLEWEEFSNHVKNFYNN